MKLRETLKIFDLRMKYSLAGPFGQVNSVNFTREYQVKFSASSDRGGM